MDIDTVREIDDLEKTFLILTATGASPEDMRYMFAFLPLGISDEGLYDEHCMHLAWGCLRWAYQKTGLRGISTSFSWKMYLEPYTDPLINNAQRQWLDVIAYLILKDAPPELQE